MDFDNKKFPTNFGLKEPYLDNILYLGNQRYHPPPSKNLKIRYVFIKIGNKDKMSRNFTLSRRFEIKLNLRHFTFHPNIYIS